MAVEGIGDDRTAPLGQNKVEGSWDMFFLLRDAKHACGRRKKAGHGCCGRTIEAQPVSDQTCHIEDELAAPCQSRRKDFETGGFPGDRFKRLAMRSLAMILQTPRQREVRRSPSATPERTRSRCFRTADP